LRASARSRRNSISSGSSTPSHRSRRRCRAYPEVPRRPRRARPSHLRRTVILLDRVRASVGKHDGEDQHAHRDRGVGGSQSISHCGRVPRAYREARPAPPRRQRGPLGRPSGRSRDGGEVVGAQMIAPREPQEQGLQGTELRGGRGCGLHEPRRIGAAAEVPDDADAQAVVVPDRVRARHPLRPARLDRAVREDHIVVADVELALGC